MEQLMNLSDRKVVDQLGMISKHHEREFIDFYIDNMNIK
jgi:hypothetical protein